MTTHSSILAWRIPGTEEPGRLLSMGLHRVGHDWSNLACVRALEKEMATHSSILAWRIPGTEEPGGLPSMGLHEVGHDWSDLAAAAAVVISCSVLFTLRQMSQLVFCGLLSASTNIANIQRLTKHTCISQVGFYIVCTLPGVKTDGLPRGLSGEESCQCERRKRRGPDPWVTKSPWGREWQPTPAFLSGKLHRQRSLAGYSLWSRRVRHGWTHPMQAQMVLRKECY